MHGKYDRNIEIANICLIVCSPLSITSDTIKSDLLLAKSIYLIRTYILFSIREKKNQTELK